MRQLAVPEPRPVSRFAVRLSGDLFDRLDPNLALSPDGQTLVYVAVTDGVQQLYERRIDQFAGAPIRGTEGARHPFFSPNGEWVAFFAAGTLKKVPLAGGPPESLCETPAASGGSWTGDDTIVFGSQYSGLSSVPAVGGNPEPLTELGPDEVGHLSPQVLPDGKTVLFSVSFSATRARQFAVQSMETKDRRMLGDGVSARLSPTGHLVFARDETLWAVLFDPNRLDVVGQPVPLLSDVQLRVRGAADFTFANDGTLIYVPTAAAPERVLAWVDRAGDATVIAAESRAYRWPHLSPDGTKVLVNVGDGSDQSIWIYDRPRETWMLLPTTEGGTTPMWTLDGTGVVFTRSSDIYSTPADGSGEAILLLTREFPGAPTSWTPDGQTLVLIEINPVTDGDIWAWPLDGSPTLVLGTPADERSPSLSPGGRWLAYTSDETGREEVYVRAFDGSGGAVPVSRNGGSKPNWSPVGDELFYWAEDRMMVVAAETEPVFKAGPPDVVFEGQYSEGLGTIFDIAPDGQGFLILQDAEQGALSLNIIQNWFSELERLLPSN